MTRASLDAVASGIPRQTRQSYGHANRAEPVQLVNLRLTAIGRLPALTLAQPGDASAGEDASSRDVWFAATGFAATPVHWRPGLPAGALSPDPRYRGR